MPGFDPEFAAAQLAEARLRRRQIELAGPAPQSAEDAYAVQDALLRRLGPAKAWKVGAKGPAETPNAAPILDVRQSPATWAASDLHMIGVEAEIAFRMAHMLPTGAKPPSADEVYGAVASVHAAIEVVDTRIADWREADRLWLLTDNQSNGGLVCGSGVADWRNLDFTRQPVRLAVDGRTLIETVGGNPAGDPRRLLVWLVNHLVRRRHGIEAGAFVTTGSCTGMIFVDPGAEVEAAFAGLGSATVAFRHDV